MGRISKEKNLDVLVRVFQKLNRLKPTPFLIRYCTLIEKNTLRQGCRADSVATFWLAITFFIFMGNI
ncbi:MAG: hypothetical protein C4518_09340 [Desulfobacteraceae bacterium]|nr:MAG: hypothetical protein C4518_09340 [Desulfobacteraceae bacterium]